MIADSGRYASYGTMPLLFQKRMVVVLVVVVEEEEEWARNEREEMGGGVMEKYVGSLVAIHL